MKKSAKDLAWERKLSKVRHEANLVKCDNVALSEENLALKTQLYKLESLIVTKDRQIKELSDTLNKITGMGITDVRAFGEFWKNYRSMMKGFEL